MANLAEQIAKLYDPTPKYLDPEDEVNVETTARVAERFDEDSVIQSEVSSLRQTTAPLLEHIDARYVGKKISRKSLEQTYESENESSETEESEDDATNEDISSFIKQIRESSGAQHGGKEESDGSRSPEAESDSSESDEESDDNDSDEESDDNDSDGQSDEEVEEQDTEEDMFKKFSHIDVNEEIEKGKAVEAQIALWNKFCECRIRFQKILTVANRLPQFDTWDDFKKKGDRNYLNAVKKGPVHLKSLLHIMLELQSQLLLSNPETKSLVTTANCLPAQENDEMSSGSESESDKTDVKHKKNPSEGGAKKRKLELDEYGNILAKRFKAFVPYRNSVIQKWDDKTRLTVGKMTQKSFSAFNQSAVKQMDQILQNKQRLIQRTQLKRSVYSILGKNEEKEISLCPTEEKNEMEGDVQRDEHLNCYDPEIFDDDDFYRVLLKDVIESKALVMDPDILRTHMEIQRNRKKMKKKVDTKASKGRKIRYDPHPKLISFMASVYAPHMYAEETKDDLFKRLFNHNPAVVAQ